MSKQVWAGVGAAAVSVTALFSFLGQKDEPVKEEPSPFTIYANEVAERARLYAPTTTSIPQTDGPVAAPISTAVTSFVQSTQTPPP